MSVKDSHRLFLRTLMSRQFMSDRELKRLHRQCCEAYEGNISISRQIHIQVQ